VYPWRAHPAAAISAAAAAQAKGLAAGDLSVLSPAWRVHAAARAVAAAAARPARGEAELEARRAELRADSATVWIAANWIAACAPASVAAEQGAQMEALVRRWRDQLSDLQPGAPGGGLQGAPRGGGRVRAAARAGGRARCPGGLGGGLRARRRH
jgi:hypothetical protein